MQSDDFILFKDIRPATKHHYLVCPKNHIDDAKRLKKRHLPMGKLVYYYYFDRIIEMH